MTDNTNGTEQELPAHVQTGVQEVQQQNQAPEQPLQDHLGTQKQEQEVPKESEQKSETKPVADSYVATSIQYLSDELGITDDDFDAVYENAIKHNDMSLINPQALGKELTPEQTNRVTQLAQLAVQERTQNVQRAKDEIYSVAGSEAIWKTTVQAFNANASQEEQEYAAYLADTGKLKQAATYIMKFTTDGGFVTQQNQAPVQGGGSVVRQGLSKAEYTAEIGKLERERGNRSLESPAFAGRLQDLNARRALGRQQGL